MLRVGNHEPPLRDRRFWVTQLLVLSVFAAHAVLHSFYSGYPDAFIGAVYAFPVLYAALEFGFRGSVTTTMLVVLLLPYDIDDVISGAPIDFVGHMLELAILVCVAPVVGRTVEAERSARLAHQAAELRYRVLFEASGVPAVVLGDTGRIQEANPAASALLGRILEGRTLAEVLGHEAAERLLGPGPPAQLRISPGLELRPVVSRPVSGGCAPLTQVLFQDVTEEASGHRRARAWAQAVLSAQEEERRRIAHELHDEALQLAVELRRQVERATRTCPAAEEQLHGARDLADLIIGELRTVAFRLRPPDLDDLGLVASLDRLAAEAGRRGTVAQLHVAGAAIPLSSAIALALYRVAQEALTNAEHHGRASRVALRLSLGPRAISLRIEDNGTGFDVERAESETDQVHLGLVGMRERMQLVGGALEIRSAAGHGTAIVATVARDAIPPA